MERKLTFTQRVDEFFLRSTPVWFSWLEWLAVLAALQYLLVKTNSALIGVLVVVSYIFLIMYFLAFFGKHRIKGLPFTNNEIVGAIISIILAGASAYCFWFISYQTVLLISVNH
jgi:drug/metabolite transporter (DMT)-like permease